MPDVFLSYSREDQPTAHRFAEALKREGFSVWWDQALDAGESFDEVTEQALKSARAVVVLWSRHSVASRWVRAEATQASRYHTLVPVTIEACDRPIMFELTHTADLTNWSGETGDSRWRAFIEGLRRSMGREAAPLLAQPAPVIPDAPAAPRLPRRVIWAIAAAGVLLIAGLAWHFQGREARSSTAAVHSPAALQTTLASIAVLPFKDMSQNKDQEYFADGVTEEILNTLAGLKDLKVTARTSAFAFKGKDVDLRTVGQTLGVQHILEGSIRKDGDRLRITAQLIDAKSDAHVWSKTYERPLKDIFSIQDDIARSVADALQVALGVGFGKRPGMTRDVEAYDAFLAAWPLTLQYTPENQRRAIGLLEQAVARDPSFGEAWVSLAGAYVGMMGLVTGDAKTWQQKADAATERARQVAPGSPGLHYVFAMRSINQGRWSDAAGHFDDLSDQVSRLSDSGPDPRGRFLLAVGRTREGVALLEQAKARDPLNPGPSFFLAVGYSSLRKFPAAIAEFRRGYALDESWHFLFEVGALSNAMGTRDRAEIQRLLDAQAASGTDMNRESNRRIRALLDRPAEALTYLRAQLRDPSTPSVGLTATSQWLAYFGDPKSALDALHLAYKRGAADPASFSTWYPVMRDARRLPEFKPFVRDLGFVEYWRKFGWGDFCKPVGTDDFECN